MNKLLELYKEYVTLLNDELGETMTWASTHGWKSSRVEQGKILREQIKELEKNNNWISVEDGLPEHENEVLAFVKCTGFEPGMLVCYYKADLWWHHRVGLSPTEQVTHWMPLPELPNII